eukprot:2119635-Pleurochrysis_carterae.AAC.11
MEENAAAMQQQMLMKQQASACARCRVHAWRSVDACMALGRCLCSALTNSRRCSVMCSLFVSSLLRRCSGCAPLFLGFARPLPRRCFFFAA